LQDSERELASNERQQQNPSGFDLTGKVALITGASKGIGEAMPRAMAEFGASVVVSSRKQEAVDAVAQAFGEDGLEAIAIAANIRQPEDIEALWGDGEILARFPGQTPLGRAGEADDVAGLATLLASDAAANCSGRAYTADGGYLAN